MTPRGYRMTLEVVDGEDNVIGMARLQGGECSPDGRGHLNLKHMSVEALCTLLSVMAEEIYTTARREEPN